MDDKAFQAKYLSAARLLWEAAEGCFEDIPSDYARHLSHTFINGDVSLGSLLPVVTNYSEMEFEDIEEAIELLGRISPNDWPNIEDVQEVDAKKLLGIDDTDEENEFDFVEDNLGTAERVEKVIAKVIESILGEPVEKIRGKGGSFPSAANGFLQESDGTFSGSFMHGNHKFNFEIAPTESGWLCTYRLSEQTLDGLPPLPEEHKKEDDPTKKKYNRSIRTRGWK